jgi:excisionase family DNA binding protein
MQRDDIKAANRRLLSTEQVADALAVKPKTVRRWITSGELPAVKLHRQWRVPADTLERLLLGDPNAA